MNDDTQPAADTPDGTPSPDAGETITLPVSQFEALTRDGQDWKERCARLQAEFDNARKRLRKEADEAGSRAIARAMRPMLDQLDNLDRALLAATPTAFVEFAQGVTLIRDGIIGALTGNGLECIACDGVFDPAVHEVIAEQVKADVPKGTIVQVHRQGWRLKDQLVRSAQVVVAKPAP